MYVSTDGVNYNYYSGFSPSFTSEQVYCNTPSVTCSFKVAAVNGLGSGPLSAASNSVTTQSPPSAPTNPTATLTEDPCSSACGWVDVNWTAPNDGGSALTRYDVYVSTDGVNYNFYSGFSPSFTSEQVFCNTPSVTCSFKVAAVNGLGSGPLSVASNSVTTQNG